MSESKFTALSLGVLAVFALGFVLQQLQSVLLPFVLAVFLCFLFRPIVVYLTRHRIPKPVALLAVVLVISIAGFGLSSIVTSSVRSFVDQLPRYQGKLEALGTSLVAAVDAQARSLGIDLSSISLGNALPVGSLTSALSSGLGSLVGFVGFAFLIVLFMLFILAGSGQLERKIASAFAPGEAERIASVLANIDRKVRQYLLAKTLVSLATGTVTAIILTLLGVDFALLWGFLAFLLNFVPNVGSMVAVVFPLLMSIVQFDTPTRPILVVVLLVVAQNLLGNVVEPKLFASSLNLSPVLILLALIFWGWLWGIWGMILAVPITSTIKIVFEHVEPLRPVAVLMSGGAGKPGAG